MRSYSLSMRFIIPFILIQLFFHSPVLAQNFEDDFSDGDFTNNPSWVGDVHHFEILEIEGNNILRLQANEAGTSYLSTPSSKIVGYWEFYVQLKFSASNNNYTEIFLMSDIADLTGAVNGYALRWGENTASDVFRLFKITNGSEDGEVLSGTTEISSSGGYRVKVHRNSAGKWTLEVAEGYSGNLVQDAYGLDNSYESASYFGIKASYTSSNISNFYYDFKIDEAPIIVDPLLIDNVSSDFISEIDIGFSREVFSGNTETTKFLLNGSINPKSFSFIDPQTIRLTFKDPFSKGENKLFITGIESLERDTVISDTTIIFYLFDEYKEGDIIINEFLKDPPPDSDIPEYIELKNTSNKYLNIRDWAIGDNKSLAKISEDHLAIKPHSFLVLSSKPEEIEDQFGNDNNVDVSLPALNNSGDQIRLFDEIGILIDSLEYNTDWGGVDVALERRSSTIPAINRANWGDSPNTIGSPGNENSIEIDTSPPDILTFDFLENNRLQIEFTEEIKQTSAEHISNYKLISNPNNTQPIPSIKNIEYIHSVSVNVNFDFDFIGDGNGESYTLEVLNQEDVFGNISELLQINFEFRKTDFATVGDVVINEILYQRKDEFSPEFIELYNTSSKSFDLSGWTVQDATNTKATIPNETYLEAYDYVILTDREDFANSLDNGLFLSNFPSLNNSGDKIIIRNSEGDWVDSLIYSSSWGRDELGISVERIDPKNASNDDSNWSSSIAEEGFSAGNQNSIFEDDITPPHIIFTVQNEEVVTVIFSEYVKATEQSIFMVNNHESELLEIIENKANIRWLPSLKSNQNQEVSISNIEDIRGNKASTLSTVIALPITKGSIIINEIMYDPLADNEDNLPDQVEYIELFNRSNTAISLEGISLHDAPDERNEVQALHPVSSQYKWIAAGEYFLLYAEDLANNFSESKMARYFSMESETDQFSMRYDRSSLSLAASEDAIYLVDSAGVTIDSVYYDESWQNPNVFDVKGIALERINADGESNAKANWSSSTHVSGGTPNYENSIYQKPGTNPESLGINFSSNPFSPDDDGFEDHLFINYTLDSPDYLLRVRIFDRYGRAVRKLADGIPAGFEGSLIWDGLTDNQTKNRVGIYVVLFEAYNSANGSDRSFKKTVVLARMF